jgi:tetratricopeptide (TPR) repeat protein
MGDAQRAVEHAWSGTTRALQAGGLECACAGYLSLGLGRLQTDNPADALTAFEEAVRLTDSFSGDEWHTNRVHVMRAAAQVLSGRSEAMADLDGALANARSMDDQFGMAFISEVLGAGATLLGDFGRAATALNEALGHYRRNDMRPYQARALRALAELYDAQGKAAEATQAREEAERLAEALRVPAASDGSSPAAADERGVVTAKGPHS